jgi:DNA segregation ATPase FtsK/SpoIIIE-like protein
MLYLLSELFEILPEVGDLEKPKMVFFFDEAHLLFNNASKALLEKIQQVVKLIRSKGIGLFFITQSPGDIPSAVMAQLGNKIEHGLHAYTPAEQKVVKAAADSFRENPDFNTEDVLKNLGTGEAVVSTLDENGAPSVAEYAYILPPESSMGAISDETRDRLVKESLLYTKYGTAVDPDSAYEVLTRMKAQVTEAQEQAAALAAQQKQEEKEAKEQAKAEEKAQKEAEKEAAKKEKEVNKIKTNVAKTTGSSVGREVGKIVGEAVLGKKGRTIFGNIGSTIGRNIMGTLTKNK